MLTLYYTNLEFNLNSKLAKKLEKILLIRLYDFRYTYPKILKNKGNAFFPAYKSQCKFVYVPLGVS